MLVAIASNTNNHNNTNNHDPNEWCKELGDDRYVVDLIKRLVTVSLRTVEVVEGLRELGLQL